MSASRRRSQIFENLLHDVAVRRVVLHRLRRALHVHRAHAGAGRERPAESSAGSPSRPVTSLMISAPASIAAAATAALLVSIEIGGLSLPHAAPRPPAARAAALRPPPLASEYGRVLSPPISRMSAPSATSCKRVIDGRIRVEELAAVGKAIRRDVDDAHQQRPRGKSSVRVRSCQSLHVGQAWFRSDSRGAHSHDRTVYRTAARRDRSILASCAMFDP